MTTNSDQSKKQQHNANKFAWLDQVCADRRVPSGAFRVAYAIAQFWWNDKTEIFPGEIALAKATGRTRGNIGAMVAKLEELGYLHVTPGSKGRGHSNRYRPILKNHYEEGIGEAEALDRRDEENAKPTRHFTGRENARHLENPENAKPTRHFDDAENAKCTKHFAEAENAKCTEHKMPSALTENAKCIGMNRYEETLEEGISTLESVRSTQTLYEEEEDHRPVIGTTSDDADDGDSAALAAVNASFDMDDDDDADYDPADDLDPAIKQKLLEAAKQDQLAFEAYLREQPERTASPPIAPRIAAPVPASQNE
jgi:hypothetical protein